MNVLPAISREMRAQSRLPFTYGLRVLGASVLILVCAWLAFTETFSPDDGAEFFGWLNTLLIISIWTLVPLLAADCISRERREGTIGLLFLTPLKARDIVIAKVLVHGLRAGTLWLSALPIMMIPFLAGGVGWREAVLSVIVGFSSICLALAAGLLASSASKTWLRAQVLACLWAFCFAFAFIYLTGLLVSLMFNRTGQMSSEMVMQVGFSALTNFEGVWSEALGAFGRGVAGSPFSWSLGAGAMAAVSALFLVLIIEIASLRLQRVWRDEPASARRQWLEAQLYTPILWVSFLRRWMHRKLERNPIGWLEQRTWSGRLVTWAWFAVMVSLYSVVLGQRGYGFITLHRLQVSMAWLLLIGLAASAAGSFQRERETGVMELLLVSPMSIGRIISGRVRGLWGQFLPAMALLVIVWLYFNAVIFNRESFLQWLHFFIGAFLVTPVIGLYHSLRRKSFLTALLLTVFSALLLPYVAQGAAEFAVRYFFARDNAFIEYINDESNRFMAVVLGDIFELVSSPWFVTFLQLLIAARCGWRLYQNLKRRDFAFSRTIA